MRVLIACEFSGIVREAFKARGHDAWSCDLLETEIPGNHIKGDVTEILNDGWDLMIAHPTCTFLTNSGVCWLYNKDKSKNIDRWESLAKGAEFFKTLLNANIPKIAIENPIPHKYAVELIGAKYSQLIQPYQFGHAESKATCLWLEGLPELKSTNDVKHILKTLPKNESQRFHYLPPGPNRWKERSRTFSGIAKAMAEQWTF